MVLDDTGKPKNVLGDDGLPERQLSIDGARSMIRDWRTSYARLQAAKKSHAAPTRKRATK